MNNVIIGFYKQFITAEDKRYYDAAVRLMDYVNREEKKLPVIYILNVENVIYKIYDSRFTCIFACRRDSPEALLQAAIELMPKKIVLLNRLGEGISRTLMLLFNCIEYDEA